MDAKWKYNTDFSVRGYELDTNNQVTISALCCYMEEAANQHAGKLNYAVEKLLEYGRTWVLVRMYLEAYHLTKAGERVKVNTWPVHAGKVLFRRDFEMINPDASICAKATSQWAVVNMSSRKAEMIPQPMIDELSPESPDIALEDPSWKIPSQENSPDLVKFRARLADIDRNNHVNNVRYLDWILESSPYALRKEMHLHSVMMLYKAEALFRDAVIVKGSQGNEEGEFLHGMYHENGKELIRARTLWVKA